MRIDRPLLLLLAALTAGCADPEPFVDTGAIYSNMPPMEKLRDTVLTTNQFNICFSDKTPWAEVEQLATERCAAHGMKIYSSWVQRWQCRATSPHTANFRCYDPEMVGTDGTPVNPFDPGAVARWEARTGKTAKPHNILTGQTLTQGQGSTTPAQSPASPATGPTSMAPPAPAPVPVAPLSAADIANKPPIPALPPRPQAPLPPATGAYPTDGFTLPQGSWGDHFQE